jgi:PIN domain nuclease of toxin-antitoxin system
MRLLLDTHSFLWFVEGDSRFSRAARRIVEDESNIVFLSIGSLWEIAIKISIGKLTLDLPFEVLIPQQLIVDRITVLQIAVSHTIQVSKLPLHHRDPFDRLLVAQAMVEELPIVSADASLDAYGITRLW